MDSFDNDSLMEWARNFELDPKYDAFLQQTINVPDQELALPPIHEPYHADEYPVMYWPSTQWWQDIFFLTNYGRIVVLYFPEKMSPVPAAQEFPPVRPNLRLDVPLTDETIRFCHAVGHYDAVFRMMQSRQI